MTDWLLTETEIKNVHNHFNTRIKRLNFINLKGLSSVFSPQRRQDSSRIQVFFFDFLIIYLKPDEYLQAYA